MFKHIIKVQHQTFEIELLWKIIRYTIDKSSIIHNSTNIQANNHNIRGKKPIKKVQSPQSQEKLYKNWKKNHKALYKKVYDLPISSSKCHNVLIGSPGAKPTPNADKIQRQN